MMMMTIMMMMNVTLFVTECSHRRPMCKTPSKPWHHHFDCNTQSENMSELRSLEIIETLCRQLAGQFRP